MALDFSLVSDNRDIVVDWDAFWLSVKPVEEAPLLESPWSSVQLDEAWLHILEQAGATNKIESFINASSAALRTYCQGVDNFGFATAAWLSILPPNHATYYIHPDIVTYLHQCNYLEAHKWGLATYLWDRESKVLPLHHPLRLESTRSIENVIDWYIALSNSKGLTVDYAVQIIGQLWQCIRDNQHITPEVPDIGNVLESHFSSWVHWELIRGLNGFCIDDGSRNIRIIQALYAWLSTDTCSDTSDENQVVAAAIGALNFNGSTSMAEVYALGLHLLSVSTCDGLDIPADL